MPRPLLATQARIADEVVLDARLALFHERERWLAIADLHYGYELSQRVAGHLTPMWGMSSIEARLRELLADYSPARLLILGDLVHDRSAGREAARLLERLGEVCQLVLVAGNHDRKLTGSLPFVDAWRSDDFHFHHGHCSPDAGGRTQIIGHHHPAATLYDGAGLRLKFPAFVQQSSCWILPAFSPWAAGAAWPSDSDSRVWLCTPSRVFELSKHEPAPA